MIYPSVTLAVRYDDVESTQLMNYLFGSHEDDITIAEIGFVMTTVSEKVSFLSSHLERLSSRHLIFSATVEESSFAGGSVRATSLR